MYTPRAVSGLSLRKKLFFAGSLLVLFFIVVEVILGLLYGSARLHYGYRFFVNTHLQDLSWSSFVLRQDRIQAVRSRLGMERGRDHPVFGFTYNPTFRIDIPEEQIEIHINSHALRGEELPEKKPAGEIRILCLGASTTAGEEVTESQTYPARLEAILKERYPGRSIRVMNAGIAAYTLRKSFLHYALYLYRFEPDFVTIYHGINDLSYNALDTPEILPRKNYSGRALEPFVYEGDAPEGSFLMELKWEVSNIFHLMAKRSHLLALAHSALKFKAPAGSGLLGAPKPEGLEMFSTDYYALLKQIRASGAKAIPMTFAISYPGEFSPGERKKIEASFGIWLGRPNASLEAGKKILDAENELILKLCREEGLQVCDVADKVPKDGRHFVDVCHLAAEGNQAIAEALAELLIPLLDPAARPNGRQNR